MRDKLLLIDGSSLIHRAFYAMPPLQNKEGLNTGAVYGLCNMILKLITDVKPKWMVVAFDKSRKTFRTRMYEEYKAQRKPTPVELKEQFPLAIELLEMMNISTIEIDDYEADDIIGTFSKHKRKEAEVIIVTGDKDEFQLIDNNVKVFFTKKGISNIQVFDIEEFKANYEGLMPTKIIDLKGLMGDSSDNIPGVPGVGPKTAMKLILEYDNVENVLEHIDEVKGKSLKVKLAENKEQAILSKELATIFTDVPGLDLNLESHLIKPIDGESKKMMENLEFKNMWERFTRSMGVNEEFKGEKAIELPALTSNFEEIIVDKNNSISIINKLNAFKGNVYVNYTLEGALPQVGLKTLELLFNDIIYKFGETIIGETVVKEKSLFDDESEDDGDAQLCQELCKWFDDASKKKVVLESKEISKYLLQKNLKLKGLEDDVTLAAYLVNSEAKDYDLTSLCNEILVQNHGGTLQDMIEVMESLKTTLKEHNLMELYKTIEIPLAELLAKMEYTGIAIDETKLSELGGEFASEIEMLDSEICEMAGEKFNIKSPKQLGAILFEKLELPVVKKTKTGYSTDVTVLEELVNKHDIIKKILKYRHLTKLKSTYIDGLKPLINSFTARIHTHFQQTVTVTGRLSSTEPNLQNIPTRTETGKRIRELFIPGEGFDCFMSCDYSQVELRILAHIAQDHLLLDSFNKGQDVHARTAAEVFGMKLEDVSSSQRSSAKAVNFGIVYGISDYGLAKQLGTSRKEASKYIEEYFARYTGVKAYMEKTVADARKVGYVATMFGRRRYLPDINSNNFNRRSFAERTAINTPIQGTAADIIKLAMLKTQTALEEANLKSRILLQVHDELVLEVIEKEKVEVEKLVRETMESTIKLEIPLVADVVFGENWAKAK